MGAAAHVELRRLTKTYGATKAFTDVDLSIDRGTVHALVGENGAGKSTLARVIGGATIPDRGEIRISGGKVAFRSPRDALALGITSVAQELALVPSATAIDNVFLGVEDHAGPFVRRGPLYRRFDALVERTGIAVVPDVPVKTLPVAERQKVEILRALARDAELILMDEPTARLSATDRSNLMRLLRRLADAGVTMVFVSHSLDEVLAHGDVVTVMRDGRVVRTNTCASETHESLIEAMIGRSMETTYPTKHRPRTEAREVLRVSSLTRGNVFEDISFSVRAGEIVVLAGLVGSGRSEVARAVFGADPAHSGSVVVDGDALPRRGVGHRIRRGVAMIPESRRDQGLLLTRSVRENVTLASLMKFSKAGLVDHRKERRAVAGMAQRVGVRAASYEMAAGQLSGGNQQKTLFARWLLGRPRLLIADEPTRGVDVGSKQAIYELLVDLAGEGMALLVISSELDEVVGLAHRVLVMRGGRVVDEFADDQIREDMILQATLGVPIATSPQ